MPIPPLCDCGHRFEAPAGAAGLPASCPECGRNVPAPEPGSPGDVLPLGDRSGPPIPRVRWWAGLLGVVVAGLLLVALFLPATRSAREAARRSQCVNNLKQIGLAVHNYHEVYGSLPPAAVVGRDGRPLLSWRVLLLPYMEGRELYARFQLDEPWDSPRNRPLLAEMPRAFACPSDPTLEPRSGLTSYQVVVGPGTAFPPDGRPVRFDEITDGTARTLLVGESPEAVHWTKPADLRFDGPEAYFGFGSGHPGGFNAAQADGSIRFLKNSIRPAVLRALLTRAGGEALSADEY